jgi:hypothetical protein
MGPRTPVEERRSGIRLTIIGVICLALAFGMWWLVEETNPSGDHDAQLLPLFALIPLAIGLFRLIHSRHNA